MCLKDDSLSGSIKVTSTKSQCYIVVHFAQYWSHKINRDFTLQTFPRPIEQHRSHASEQTGQPNQFSLFSKKKKKSRSMLYDKHTLDFLILWFSPCNSKGFHTLLCNYRQKYTLSPHHLLRSFFSIFYRYFLLGALRYPCGTTGLTHSASTLRRSCWHPLSISSVRRKPGRDNVIFSLATSDRLIITTNSRIMCVLSSGY